MMNILEGIETELTADEQRVVLEQMLKNYEADKFVAQVNLKLARLTGDEQAVARQQQTLKLTLTAVEALKETLGGKGVAGDKE
jgi:hypothetical protein